MRLGFTADGRALNKKNSRAYAGMTPEERVLADAARDDSIIAGKLVEADPALVQAVAYELEQQGLIGGLSQADENLLSQTPTNVRSQNPGRPRPIRKTPRPIR